MVFFFFFSNIYIPSTKHCAAAAPYAPGPQGSAFTGSAYGAGGGLANELMMTQQLIGAANTAAAALAPVVGRRCKL